MSCQDCENAQATDLSAFFRWRNANIEVRGCERHVSEIFAVLRKNLPKG